MFTRRFFQVVAAVVLAAAVPGTAQSQDAFDRAKSLYLEAAYEDALALLEPAGPSSTRGRALVPRAVPAGAGARNRGGPRDRAIDRTGSAGDRCPAGRVAACRGASGRHAPAHAARHRAPPRGRRPAGVSAGRSTGRDGALRSSRAPARRPALANQAELVDLRTLASGFLDLIRAQAAPPPAATSRAALPPAAPAAGAASPPAGASGTVAASGAGSPPAAAGASVAAAPAAAPPAAAPPAPVWSWRGQCRSRRPCPLGGRLTLRGAAGSFAARCC